MKYRRKNRLGNDEKNRSKKEKKETNYLSE